MNKKSILLVSLNSFHFIQEYIANVLDCSAFDIQFLTFKANLNEEIWKEKKVTVHTLKKDGEKKLKIILMLPFRLLKIRREIKHVDIIHYHYIDYKFTHLVNFFIRNIATKTILSFWGSDLLRQSKRTVLSYTKLFRRASKINVMNIEMFNKFQEYTNNMYTNKLVPLDFGDSTLDFILDAEKSNNKNDWKIQYSVPDGKICVHLGYNGIPSQQHIKLLECLVKCVDSVKNQIHIIVPFSYGCFDDNYRNQVKKSLESSGISFYMNERFLSQKEIAEFRLTADIFLYGQTTDAVSASMIEYLASGTTVIKPSWLVYSELTDNGITMLEYKDFMELTSFFENSILNKSYKNIDTQKNRSIVLNLKSWNVLKDKWLEMYYDEQ